MKGATRASKVAAIAVLILAISIMGTSAAGGPPGGGFYSGQTIQNVGVGTAGTTVKVYDATSAATWSKDFPVAEGASTTFFLSDIPGVPSPFMGSAVVVSDQPIKAIVNVTNRKSGTNGVDGGTAAAQYRGVDDTNTGTTLVFPLAKANFRGKTTAFYIQNAGGAAATFTASFLLGTSLTDTNPVSHTYLSPSLAIGQMAVIIPADAQGVGNELIGSLTVTSGEKLAGTVMEYETATAPAKILQGTTGFTANDFDTRVLFPVVKNRFGNPTRSTGLQVQNVGDADITVNLAYKGALGTCAGQSYNEPARPLKPKQSTTYLESVIPAGCLASAEATATGPIAAVVNESYQPCSGCSQRATTYSAFPAKSATTKLVAPVFKEYLSNKYSGLTIQNVGTADTTATLVFKVGTASYTLQGVNIPMGAAVTLLKLSDGAPASSSWVGGTALPKGSLAAVTVTAGQPIIGVVNEAPMGDVQQDNINYETFNVAP